MKSKLQKYILILSFIVFSLGQIPKIWITSNIKISLLDILVFIFVCSSVGINFYKNNKPLLFRFGIFFISISFLSILLNISRLSTYSLIVGFLYLVRFVIYFLFYISIFKFLSLNPKENKTVVYGLYAVGLLVSIFGIAQYILYPDLRNLMYLGWDPHYYRLFSTFFDPNFTGIILVLSFFHFIFNKKILLTKQPFFYWLSVLITLVSILLTYSRSALISLILGLGLWISIQKKVKKELIIGGIFAVVLVILIPKPDVDVFNLFRIETSVARVNNWQKSLSDGLKSPFFGLGFGTITYTDSSLLYVFATTGIIGLIVYLAIWYRVYKFGLKDKKVLIVAVVLILNSWFNHTLFYPWILYWFYLFLSQMEVKQTKIKIDS